MEQIVAILKQAGAGDTDRRTDPARSWGIREQTFYSVEEEIQWSGDRSSPAAEADGGGKCAAEAHRGRSDFGQGHATGRAEKKF